MDLGELYTNSVTIKDLEIFRVQLSDFLSKDFSAVQKR